MAAPFAAPADDVDNDDVRTYRYPNMSKRRGGFTLNIVGAEFTSSEIILLRGQPRSGKTTFINSLAHHVHYVYPDLKVAVKPQCIGRTALPVKALFSTIYSNLFRDDLFVSTVITPLQIQPLMDKMVTNLSDSELYRVALCKCLAWDADVYLIDEPTARLDKDERLAASQVIKGFIQRTRRTAFVIERDLELATYLADRVIVFQGVPSVGCVANPPIVVNPI